MADDGIQSDAPVQVAPEPQGAPAQSTTQGAPSQQAADDFIRVPRTQLSDYGGDYHRALGDAKTGRQMVEAGANDLLAACSALGITPQELAQSIRATETTAQTGGQQTGLAASTEPEAPALTADSVRQVVQDVLQQTRQSDAETAAEQAAHNFALQTLEGEGLKLGANEKPGVLMQQGWNMFYAGLHQAKVGELESKIWLTEDQKAEAMKRPASQAALQSAAAQFKQDWADLRNEINSAAITQQQQIPGATNAGGPAGAPPTKPWNEMTGEERRTHVMGVVEQLTG